MTHETLPSADHIPFIGASKARPGSSDRKIFAPGLQVGAKAPAIPLPPLPALPPSIRRSGDGVGLAGRGGQAAELPHDKYARALPACAGATACSPVTFVRALRGWQVIVMRA
jgi:hypothetical protein